MNIEMRHLRFALAAMEHGSFRRAADRLGVRQSSVSRRVRDLEAMLDIKLFIRTAGGVRATMAGRHFLAHAQDALDRLAEAHQIVGNFRRDGGSAPRSEVGPIKGGDIPAPTRSLISVNWPLMDTAAAIAVIEALLDALRSTPTTAQIPSSLR